MKCPLCKNSCSTDFETILIFNKDTTANTIPKLFVCKKCKIVFAALTLDDNKFWKQLNLQEKG